MMEITDEMVERLALFLQVEWAGPYHARVGQFTNEEIKEGKLREADEAAERKSVNMARAALECAFQAAGNTVREPATEKKYRLALQRIAAEESGVWGTIAREALEEDSKREEQ